MNNILLYRCFTFRYFLLLLRHHSSNISYIIHSFTHFYSLWVIKCIQFVVMVIFVASFLSFNDYRTSNNWHTNIWIIHLTLLIISIDTCLIGIELSNIHDNFSEQNSKAWSCINDRPLGILECLMRLFSIMFRVIFLLYLVTWMKFDNFKMTLELFISWAVTYSDNLKLL